MFLVSVFNLSTQQRQRSHTSQDGQFHREVRAVVVFLLFARGQNCFGVFPELFGDFKKLVIERVVVVFAFIGRIRPADGRAIFVDAASVIIQQVAAVRVDHQIPRPLIDKERDSSVCHVPADAVEIVPGFGGIDRQGEISAAFGCTVLAEHLARLEVLAAELRLRHGELAERHRMGDNGDNTVEDRL